MLIFLLLLHITDVTRTATDFENARISGTPRLMCSKKSITVFFETNIPFQGRISVMKKMYIPECNQDYSTNILRNATFQMDIGRCTETTYMTNGSRVLTAHLEIGFHPLVVTSSDRVYSVQCIDNSYIMAKRHQQSANNANCSHMIRTASKWEGLTIFHVGDAVVHEWSCLLDPQEMGNTQVFLTSCNAISQAGQIIHLIDENGCVVDSELMGDLVYNKHIPKIYARAKVFKLMNGERYRIECTLQMCKHDGSCMNRPYPPKCAFTKDEIVSRYDNRVNHSAEDALMTGGVNARFDKQTKVTSEWITVHNNQYTNVDQLHERYFINTVMDFSIKDEATTTVPMGHFLMSISYRDPGRKFQTERERTNGMAEVTNIVMTVPTSFKPQNNPVISSSEESQIESISEELASIMPVVPASRSNTVKNVSLQVGKNSAEKKEVVSSAKINSRHSPNVPSRPPTFSVQMTAAIPERTTTKPTTKLTTAPIPKFSSAMATAELKVKKKATTTPIPVPPTIFTVKKSSKSPLKGSVATMRFYTDNEHTTSKKKPAANVYSTTEMPFEEDNKIFTNMAIASRTVPPVVMQPIGKDNFANPRDWRLDDRTINDTDIFSSDKQIACTNNNSTMNPLKRCIWSGLDHLLVAWSFGSALVWIVMLAVCFYKNSKKKPDWVSYRQKEIKRTNKTHILPPEHPWLHEDAFEEPKLRKKHEIDMSKF